MKRIAPLVALALVLVLTMTSVTMAVARGQPRPVEWVELCSGHGAAGIMLDAQGNPVEPVGVCPDCTLTPLAAVADAAGPLLRLAPAARTVLPGPAGPVAERSPAPVRARGPPAPV